MSKRQDRFFYEGLKNNFPAIIGKTVDVILKSGVVFHGRIVSADDSQLKLENKRLKSCEIALSNIYEVILDKDDILDPQK